MKILILIKVYNRVQTSNCKINCTKVKWTATNLHKGPDETDRARSWSVLQKKDSESDSGPKPDSGELRLHAPDKDAVKCAM